MRKLFYGISRMWGITAAKQGYVAGKDMQKVSCYTDAWMVVENGKILAVGGAESTQGDWSARNGAIEFDLGGVEVLPGLVDSHTHIVFAAPRHEEFAMRTKGATYEEIAAAGGGILNSAKKLQLMDEQSLYDQAAQRLRLMISHGTTTVEIKSGYGLTVDAELKMLQVIKRLKADFPILIKSTFLGAHGIPKEYKSRPDAYVDLVVNEMLPKVVAQGLADHIDVFCDKGFFTVEQTDRILKAAAKLGLPSKIHANELGFTGGVQVAVANESWSADHLEHCGDEEFVAFKQSMQKPYGGTMPVGLPGTSYFLGIPYAPARRLIDSGLPFAMATDFNPGSSPLCSLQMIWALGCTQMKLTPEEGFHSITTNAARALRLSTEIGSLAAGQRADFFTTKTPNAIQAIPYFVGQNHCHEVYVNGELFENIF